MNGWWAPGTLKEQGFKAGEVLAVRGDPNDDKKSPFWICAVHAVKKNVRSVLYSTLVGA